jgi:RHS repeat-associated protein
MTGPMAKTNPFRFSTKYQDDETDLLYYGYRYYNASTGRWLSRDRIGESDGPNVYSFLGNRPTDDVDTLGDQGFFIPQNSSYVPRNPYPEVPTSPINPFPPGELVPDWFRQSADEGKPCCCKPPARLETFRRTDPAPERFFISMQVDLEISGCYKDLAIVWWTCFRPDGGAGVKADCNGSLQCSFAVFGVTLPWGERSSGPHLTQTRIRYLSCENGRWKQRMYKLGRSYTWEQGRWVGGGDNAWMEIR